MRLANYLVEPSDTELINVSYYVSYSSWPYIYKGKRHF